MANITCKFCGRVFTTKGSKNAHEEAANDGVCRWTRNSEKEKNLAKFVPPIDDAKKQEIANWYFNPNKHEEMNDFALEQYNKLLTPAPGRPVSKEDEKVSAVSAEDGDWSNLPGANLNRKFTPGIFGEEEAAASLTDDVFSEDYLQSAEIDLDMPGMFVLGKGSGSSEGGKRRRKTRKTRKKRRSRKNKRKTRKKRRKKRRKKKRKTRKKRRKGRN